MNETLNCDAVVIGSGFGGSIGALRLSEAGKSVIVLERGKRYKPGEFPRDVTDVNKLFWRYPRDPESRGLYDVRFFSDIGAVVASGVGGGSLVYANIHIRPDPVVFDDPRWPRSFNRASLDPYYYKVAAMLGIAPLPAEIPLAKRDVFRAAAKKLGRDVFDPDMAVSWNDPGEPGREKCRLATECEFGCQFGAKNTLDFTYLAKAEKLGARILPGSFATRIEPQGESFRVSFTDVQSGEQRHVTARRVLVSAGTLGTNELLLRCRDEFHTLPNLSPRLGQGYSGNGDFLGSIQNSSTDLKPWEGPDVTSVARYFDATPQFTMAAPTFSKPVMEVLAAMGQRDSKLLRLLSPLWCWLDCLAPWAFKKGLLSHPNPNPGPHAGDPARMTNLFAIGRDNANGRIRLSGRKGIDIRWDYERENQALIEKMTAAMRAMAGAYGGTFAPIATWTIFKRILTVHSLGGCHLAESPETGVVSVQGEAFGHPGLYVADGSVIPTAIGFHPVMTISAVSERIAEAMAKSF